MAGDVLPDPDDPDPPELPPVEGAGSVGFGEITSATVSVTGLIGAVTAVGIDGLGAATVEGFGAAPEVEVGVGLDVGVEPVDVGADPLEELGAEPPPDPPVDFGVEPPDVPPEDFGAEPPEESLEDVGADTPEEPPEEPLEGAFTSGALTCTPPTSSAWATPGRASAASNATTIVRRSLVLRAGALAKGNIVDSQKPLVGHAAVQ